MTVTTTSEYTPTTGDIRDTWEHSLIEGVASDESKADARWDSDRMAAQFDRWLDQYTRRKQAEVLRGVALGMADSAAEAKMPLLFAGAVRVLNETAARIEGAGREGAER